jgi:putative hemolysin
MPLRIVAWFTRPLVWLFTASSNVVLRAFRDETTFTESRLSPDELQQLVEEAANAGTVPMKAGDIAARALDFAHLDVRSVMTPRGDVVVLRRAALREELLRALAVKPHDRDPVVETDLDQPVGYIVVRDIARLLADGDADLESMLNPPAFVASSMKAVEALTEMQRTGSQLVMVVDELGAVIGLVTLEDLVEELVGDVIAEKERPEPPVERAPDGTARVRGRVAVHEVNRALGLELPDGPGWTTIGGLVTSVAGRIPKPGSSIVVDGVRVEVLDATQRRVLSVRLHPRHNSK